jgi:hypothetical protein
MRGPAVTDPHHHPVFGDLTSDDEFWEGEIPFEGRPIAVDLNAGDEGELDLAVLEGLTGHLLNTAALIKRCREALVQEANDDPDSSVVFYRTHHVEEVSPELLNSHLGADRLWETDVPTFVERLRVDRIGLYPHEPDAAFVVDFTISPDVTNYLLSVMLDADANPAAVTFES